MHSCVVTLHMRMHSCVACNNAIMWGARVCDTFSPRRVRLCRVRMFCRVRMWGSTHSTQVCAGSTHSHLVGWECVVWECWVGWDCVGWECFVGWECEAPHIPPKCAEAAHILTLLYTHIIALSYALHTLSPTHSTHPHWRHHTFPPNRVAWSHRMPYLHRSFSAKEPNNQWHFCEKWLATEGILWVFATLYEVRMCRSTEKRPITETYAYKKAHEYTFCVDTLRI